MSKFTGDLNIRFAGNTGNYAILMEPIIWELDEKGSGSFITIPTGFISDGMSVPRIMWWFMPPWGDISSRAAILHDWLLIDYKNNLPFWNDFILRKNADDQFYLALKATKTHEFRARILWLGVRSYSLAHLWTKLSFWSKR